MVEEYQYTPMLKRIHKKHPDHIRQCTQAEVRDRYEKLGYEVIIEDDDAIRIRKGSGDWRDVGYVDEWLYLTGPAAAMLDRQRLINAIASRRRRRDKANADPTTGHVRSADLG